MSGRKHKSLLTYSSALSYCVKNHISKSSMGFNFGWYRGIATKYETPEIHDLHQSHNLYFD